MSWLNSRRLRDYPRLIGFAFWAVLLVNVLLRNGWFGGFGGILSFDFVPMVAAAKLFWTDIANLYNFEAQFSAERLLFHPTPLEGGGNIFTYPPYVALPYSIFLGLPYAWSFVLWTAASIVALVVAVQWMFRHLVSDPLKESGLSKTQLLVLTFSFFPTVYGLFQGQNNSLTLLLAVGVLVCMKKERWYLAGILAGLMLYKPHFCIAFVLLWLIWKKFKAIAAFGGVVTLWLGGVLITRGLEPFYQYLQILPDLMYLPYGIGRYVEVTLFSLIATLLPMEWLPILLKVLQGILVVSTLFLVWLAYRFRNDTFDGKIPVLILALLYPFVVAPHALNHDMVLLIPAFVLWGRISNSRRLLYGVIAVYVGNFGLLALTRPTGVALLALLPIGMAVGILLQTAKTLRNRDTLSPEIPG